MTTHDDPLARVQALRFAVGGYYTHLGPHLPESITEVLADHLDDVLNRHYRTDTTTMYYLCAGCRRPWPCPDFGSVVRLLDALDGGAS